LLALALVLQTLWLVLILRDELLRPPPHPTSLAFPRPDVDRLEFHLVGLVAFSQAEIAGEVAAKELLFLDCG